jgi:hypothetical protein
MTAPAAHWAFAAGEYTPIAVEAHMPAAAGADMPVAAAGSPAADWQAAVDNSPAQSVQRVGLTQEMQAALAEADNRAQEPGKNSRLHRISSRIDPHRATDCRT